MNLPFTIQPTHRTIIWLNKFWNIVPSQIVEIIFDTLCIIRIGFIISHLYLEESNIGFELYENKQWHKYFHYYGNYSFKISWLLSNNLSHHMKTCNVQSQYLFCLLIIVYWPENSGLILCPPSWCWFSTLKMRCRSQGAVVYYNCAVDKVSRWW